MANDFERRTNYFAIIAFLRYKSIVLPIYNVIFNRGNTSFMGGSINFPKLEENVLTPNLRGYNVINPKVMR